MLRFWSWFSFAREKLEGMRFAERNQLNRERNLDRLRLEADTFPALDLMVGLSFVLLAFVGGMRVMNGQGDVGQFFAYQWYLWGNPLEEPGTVWPDHKIGIKGILSHWDCRPGSWDLRSCH